MHVTFLGLGNMGAACARAQLEAGIDVTIWNRTMSKPVVADLVKDGALAEEDLGRAIKAGDHLMICLPNFTAIYECLNSLSEAEDDTLSVLHTPKVVVNFTSGTPADAQMMAAWMKCHGALAYVDVAIIAAPYQIGNSASLILYSGAFSNHSTDMVQSLLNNLGRARYQGAAIGGAQLYGTAIYAATYGMLGGLILSMALLSRATRDGVIKVPGSTPKDHLSTTLHELINPSLSMLVENDSFIAEEMGNNASCAGSFPMGMIVESLRGISRTCSELGVDSSPIESLLRLSEQEMSASGNDQGLVQLVHKLRDRPKPQPRDPIRS